MSTARTTRAVKIEVEAATISIRSWTLTDEAVVASAQRVHSSGGDLENWLAAAVRIGVAALDGTGTSHQLHSVQQDLDALTREVGASVKEALNRLDERVQAVVADGGPLALASQHAVTRLANGVQQLISGPDAQVPTVIVRSVDEAVGRIVNDLRASLATTTAALQHTVTQDRLTAADHVRHALSSQIEALRHSLEEMRTAIAAEHAAGTERARTVIPGRRYEQHVVDELTRLVSQTGGLGTVAATGAARGVDASRLGDAVIDFTEPQSRVAVEAKLRNRPLDTTAWSRQLASVRKAREAAVAIGITTSALAPVPGERLVLVSPCDLVVAWDPDDEPWLLAATIAVARFAAQAATGPGAEVDTTKLLARLRELTASLQPLQVIQTQAALINRAGSKITETAATLQADLQRRLTLLQQELTRSGVSGEADDTSVPEQ